jgi:hypothetical protein
VQDVAGRQVPLRAVLVHEIGHRLGFRDACGERGHIGQAGTSACSEAERAGVMFAYAQRVEPSEAEVTVLCRWYPR